MATKKIKTAQGRKEHPKKALAKLLCVDQGYDLKQISEMLDINVNTLSIWNRSEDWKLQQAARKAGPDRMLLRCYEQMARLFDAADKENRPMTEKEMDGIGKLGATITRLDKTANVSIVMTVLKNFNNYLVLIEPDMAKQLVDFQLNYVQGLIEANR